VDAIVGGRKVRACIDTGSEPDLWSYVDLPLTGFPLLAIGSGWGRHGLVYRRSLSGTVQLGKQEYTDVRVVRGLPSRLGRPPSLGAESPDVIIGIDLLKRQPMWLDFEKSCLRLWTSTEPIPYPFDVTPRPPSTQPFPDPARKPAAASRPTTQP